MTTYLKSPDSSDDKGNKKNNNSTAKPQTMTEMAKPDWKSKTKSKAKQNLTNVKPVFPAI